MIYDKKKIATINPPDGFWQKHPDLLGKFVGRYEAQGIGIRYVRNACGKVVVFDTGEAAERAAKDALINAFHNNPPMIAQRTIVLPNRLRNGSKVGRAAFKR